VSPPPALPPEAVIDRLRPIFIVGCGHSGTTLLAAMLDSHSRILAFPDESSAFSQDDWPARAGPLLALARRAEQRGIPRICEKTPNHVHRIGRILGLMPHARILYVVRDGRDVAHSILRRYGDLDSGARRWMRDNRAGLRQSEGEDRVHLLRYEDLVADPAATLAAACAFIGEAYEPAMLDFHRTERRWLRTREIATVEVIHEPGLPEPERDARHRQRRNFQINQQLFDGRGGWKTLPEDRQAALTEMMRPLLRFGYL
jgi:hypothetical protein